MRALFAVALLLPSFAALAEEPKRPLIAVLEFRTRLGPQEQADADPTYFSDVVRSQALDELPAARIMTRENMTVLLAAAGKELSECEGECDVETGRNLGADEVINGELLKVGTSFKLDLKLHATVDGRLLAGAQASGKSVDELDAALPAAVTKLLAPLRAAPPAAAPAAPAPAAPVATTSPSGAPIASAPRPSAAPPAPSGAAPRPLISNATARPLAPTVPSPYRLIRVVDDRIVYRQSFFAPGRRDLLREALPVLREIAAALRGPPERRAAIICRAESGTGAARRIALQRAWTLRHALVELGLAPSSLQPRGADAAGQARLVRQVAHPYLCEITLR